MFEGSESNTSELFSEAKVAGATLVGVADLNTLRDLPTYGGVSLEGFSYAVSVAVALPPAAIEAIRPEDPGVLYALAYKNANALLDSIAMRIASKIYERGYLSLALPASFRVDQQKLLGHASHKAFAWAAGLGWIGRNGLLITPSYGPAVRLATVLTDMPLKPGKPIENGCGDCRICVESCPTKALKYSGFLTRPKTREEILDPAKCNMQLNKNKERFASNPPTAEVAVTVCGICIKVCPIGKNPTDRHKNIERS